MKFMLMQRVMTKSDNLAAWISQMVTFTFVNSPQPRVWFSALEVQRNLILSVFQGGVDLSMGIQVNQARKD